MSLCNRLTTSDFAMLKVHSLIKEVAGQVKLMDKPHMDFQCFCHIIGRVPSLATYTKLRVDWRDRFKLSVLHGSGNVSYYKIRR